MIHKESHSAGKVQITATSGPISKSHLIDQWTSENKIWKLPDSFFGDNTITITSPLFQITFSGRDSIKYLRFSDLSSKFVNPEITKSDLNQLPFFFPNDIKVSNAKLWNEKKHIHNNEVIKEQIMDQDWTFLNHFMGNYQLSEKVNFEKIVEGIEIPKDRLSQNNKILFYKDLYLYDDDLGDFGYSSLRARIRVQSDSVFVLMRSYVRIDGTMIRSVDNRLFLDLEDLSIIRDMSFLEGTYDEIKQNGFVFDSGFNTDNDQSDKIARYLKVCHHSCEKILFK